eukprot:scaffold28929_cov29-Prasinocladus_malaysianus.AAC.1
MNGNCKKVFQQKRLGTDAEAFRPPNSALVRSGPHISSCQQPCRIGDNCVLVSCSLECLAYAFMLKMRKGCSLSDI